MALSDKSIKFKKSSASILGRETEINKVVDYQENYDNFKIFGSFQEVQKLTQYLKMLSPEELKKLTGHTSEIESPLQLTGERVKINAEMKIKRHRGGLEIHLTSQVETGTPSLSLLDSDDLKKELQKIYTKNNMLLCHGFFQNIKKKLPRPL